MTLIEDHDVERQMLKLINAARVDAGRAAVEHHQWLRVGYGDWLIDWFLAGQPEPYYGEDRAAERAEIARRLGFREVGERIASFELRLGDMLRDASVPEELTVRIVEHLLDGAAIGRIMLDPRFSHVALAVVHEELFDDVPNYRTWICRLFAR